jgi:lysophospholipase L1-like esterase
LIIKNYKYHILKSKSDLYIIAIGTNDVRYRDPEICAMTKEEYIENIKNIVKFAKFNNKNSNFLFISPWLSMPDDNISKLKEKEKNKLLDEYGKSLKNYCEKNNYLYINPNLSILRSIKNNKRKYIIDQIHPNENDGIELYSESVLINSK